MQDLEGLFTKHGRQVVSVSLTKDKKSFANAEARKLNLTVSAFFAFLLDMYQQFREEQEENARKN